MKKNLSKKLIVAYVLIFVAGVFAGQALAVWAIKSALPPKTENQKTFKKHNPEKMEKKLADKLDLNEEQTLQFKRMLADMRKKIRKENAAGRKKIREIINETFNNIETVLNEEQKNKFRRLKNKLSIFKKRGNRFGRHLREHRNKHNNCIDLTD